MAWVGRLVGGLRYPEQRVWLVVAGWAAVLIGLAVVSSVSYSGVILAHASVTLSPSRTVDFRGTTAKGALVANGSVLLTVRLVVTNPSPRLLAFASISYKAWIEDLPAEAGLPNLGRVDAVFDNGTGRHLFFEAFLGSLDVNPVIVPALNAGILQMSFALSHVSDPARFAAVQNITEYAAHVLGNGTVAPWIHWVLVALRFQDLPPPSATASGYVTDIVTIVLQEGPNLG